ncbi:MAG: ABC transporter permease [Bacteroidota bacterium]
MLKQLVQLIGVQFKEFFREPGIIFWAFLFPILMAWGLGIAFTKKGELVQRVAVVIDNSDTENLDLTTVAGFENNLTPTLEGEWEKRIGNDKIGITNYKFNTLSWEDAITQVKKGKVDLIMFTKDDQLSYHFDPLNPEAQLAYLQISSALSTSNFQESSDEVEPLTQVGTRYIDFLIPGLIGMNIMMSCMWGISYSMIDKRAKKLLRRMEATPMKKPIFLLAQFIARLTLGTMEAIILIIFAHLYFDIRIEGNVLALLLTFIAGNMAFTGLAILISSRTANPQIGNGLINLVVMPMMVLSGVFFSYHNFPDWAVSFIELLPLTMLADTMRSIFTEGMGLAEALKPIAVLLAIGAITFTTGLRVYKWY